MKSFGILRRILSFINLESDLEKSDLVYQEIKKYVAFRSTNLWILIFATIVASVGLNMNSTAVIIGAMLISPLMGPINGMGYSIATYDFYLFKTSLKNCSSLNSPLHIHQNAGRQSSSKTSGAYRQTKSSRRAELTPKEAISMKARARRLLYRFFCG